MLPARYRMRRRADFTAAVRRGRRAGGALVAGHLLVPGVPARQAGLVQPPRIGFVVGRAVGPAVTRNRVRRRLRHLARGYLHRLPEGSLLVLRANPPAATASHAELAAELDTVIRALLRRQGGAV